MEIRGYHGEENNCRRQTADHAGKATPAPPVGSTLGPYGINMMEFIKGYNEKTAAQIGTVVPVEITIFEDRSFTFITKTPPAAELIKKAAGAAKGSGRPNREKVGTLTPGADAADRRRRKCRT